VTLAETVVARAVGCRIAIEHLRDVTDKQAERALQVLLGETWRDDPERAYADLALETPDELAEHMRRAVETAIKLGVAQLEVPGALGDEGSTLNEIACVLVGWGFGREGDVNADPAKWVRWKLHQLAAELEGARRTARLLARKLQARGETHALIDEALAYPQHILLDRA